LILNNYSKIIKNSNYEKPLPVIVKREPPPVPPLFGDALDIDGVKDAR
jgi:hypothetical protein